MASSERLLLASLILKLNRDKKKSTVDTYFMFSEQDLSSLQLTSEPMFIDHESLPIGTS